MNLISHLNAGMIKWSPTSFKVQSEKSFVTALVLEKLIIPSIRFLKMFSNLGIVA